MAARFSLGISIGAFLVFATACTSGGNTGNAGNHSTTLPTAPNGTGVAGILDGTWRVVNATPLADPPPVGNPAVPIQLQPGKALVISNGVITEIDGVPANALSNAVTSAQPYNVDFYSNASSANVLTYCLGVTFLDNPVFSAGLVRIGMIGGTVTATTAVAHVVSETQLSGFKVLQNQNVNVLGGWRIELQKQ